MKTAYYISISIGICYCVFVIGLQIQPLLLFTLGALCAFFGLAILSVASIIKGSTNWRKESKLWFGPALVCVGFILSVPIERRIGNALADLQFKKNFIAYAKIVDDIKTGAIPCKSELGNIDLKTASGNSDYLMAARYPDGSTIVVITTGTGLPLIHVGYLYNGSGTNTNCQAQFNTLENKLYLRRVFGDWYHFTT